MPTVRILLLADTHLAFGIRKGASDTHHPRAPDFMRNYRAALRPAREGRVDLVVHGGDVFHRSQVPRIWVSRAMKPLFDVADRGIPVFVVPGNHERSRIPFPLLTAHPEVHIFQQPGTRTVTVRGVRVAVSGFPFVRHVAGEGFESALLGTRWRDHGADVRILCMHQTVEGASVGPGRFVFRAGRDVVAGRQIPEGFDAVLSGHIHRTQVLKRDLSGAPLPAPVIYPGSVERTSFAEIDEEKGYRIVEAEVEESAGERRAVDVRSRHIALSPRPMVQASVNGLTIEAHQLERWLRRAIEALPPSAVARLKIDGELDAARLGVVSRVRDQAAEWRPDAVVTLRPTFWTEARRGSRS